MFKDVPDLKWILLILLGVFVLWVLLEGPDRYEDESGTFIHPPAPLDSGETYNTNN